MISRELQAAIEKTTLMTQEQKDRMYRVLSIELNKTEEELREATGDVI